MNVSPDSRASNSTGPQALQVLFDASAMLLASTGVPAVLSGILDLASQVISADAYAVWRTYDEGSTWRILASRGLSKSYRTELYRSSATLPESLRAVTDVSTDASLDGFIDTYEAEGIRSLLAVPMTFSGQNTGTITFYWRTPHTFPPVDVAYASALANLSAAALNLSELQEQNQREKGRLSFLAEASAVLASSLDYELTLHRVAYLAVPHIADWCTIHIMENGTFSRLVIAHADPAQLVAAEEYSRLYPEQIRPDRGLGAVLRTGQPEVYRHITDEMLVDAATDEEHLRALRALGLTSSILVPLCSRGTVLGAVRLLAAGGTRSFTQDDVQLAEDLARRAATAIENAQLHRTLVDQENRLRLAHSAARMGTWTWDLARRQVFWSEEFKALHGIASHTIPSVEESTLLVHPDDRDQIGRDLRLTLGSDQNQLVFEHRSIAADGRVLWIHSRGRIERDSSGRAVSITGISMDITERRQAEEALRRTEKLAAAGRLAATVAHEVNNPLEALINLIYISKGVPGLPAEVAALLTSAEVELGRMAHIVRQTLGFYRESSRLSHSDIGTIVSEVLDLYASRILTRSLDLTLDIAERLSADVVAGELKQVIANLISNAIDATEPGGALRITVSRTGSTVQIVIADSGTGIEEANLSRLFEPFFTTKTDVGVGLGLWVSKGIMDKHNGTILVTSSTSAERHGTTVTLSLPLA